MKKLLKSSLKRAGRVLLTLIMVVLSAGLIQTIALLALQAGKTPVSAYAALGFSIGLLLFSIISPFVPVYVLGHELTHWLVAKLFRRETSRFRLQAGSGSVDVKDPNIWIVLAPYFVPLYTLLWILLLAIAGIWWRDWTQVVTLYGGMGFTYAHHLVLTVLAIYRGQSDLRIYGPFLSFALIMFINFALLYAGLAILTHNGLGAPGLLWSTYVQQWQGLLNLF